MEKRNDNGRNRGEDHRHCGPLTMHRTPCPVFHAYHYTSWLQPPGELGAGGKFKLKGSRAPALVMGGLAHCCQLRDFWQGY